MYTHHFEVKNTQADNLMAARRERADSDVVVCRFCGKNVENLFVKEWHEDGTKVMACLACCSK